MNSKEKLVSYFLFLSFIAASFFSIFLSFKAGHDSWSMTEWLINYAGGFVRRGLPGEIIYQIKLITEIHANHIAIAISVVAFLCVIYKFSFGIGGILPAAVIFSPVVLGSAAYGSFIVRKDILGIVFLILCLHFIKNIYYGNLRYFLINIVGIFAILSHESFFFFGFPALVVAGIIGKKTNNVTGIRSLVFSIFKLIPMVIAFAATVLHHGDASIANAINNSLFETWSYIGQVNCCIDQPSAAIDALQWSSKKGISLSLSVLNDFSFFIYVPLVWIFTLAICFWFLVGFIKSGDSILSNERQRLATVLVFQIIMISPLFVVGWDFGRWIFLWTASSILIFNSELNYEVSILKWLHDKLGFVNSSGFKKFSPRYWQLLIFSVPSCCWTLKSYFLSNPFGFLIGKAVKFYQVITF